MPWKSKAPGVDGVKKAEILVNGPKGFSFSIFEVGEDGVIYPADAEAALASALNRYNELSEEEAHAVEE